MMIEGRGIKPVRVISGTLMTSLDASGFSVTLLKATPLMLDSLDAGTSAIGWPKVATNFLPYEGKQVIDGAVAQSGSHKPVSSGPTGMNHLSLHPENIMIS